MADITEKDLIERYAKVENISYKEAEEKVGAPTVEEILKNIEDKTLERIRANQMPMNRKQRRALKKKLGAKAYAEVAAEKGDVAAVVSETAAKLNYIDLIQKLRKLNEEKGEQDYGDSEN